MTGVPPADEIGAGVARAIEAASRRRTRELIEESSLGPFVTNPDRCPGPESVHRPATYADAPSRRCLACNARIYWRQYGIEWSTKPPRDHRGRALAVHLRPSGPKVRTLCCDRYIHSLPVTDRLTDEPGEVTCQSRSRGDRPLW